MLNSPIHVCQQNSSKGATIIKWALKPFIGLCDVPMEICKSGDKTIVKMETQQGRILDGVRGFAGLAQNTFNLTDNPIKVETEDMKTIITMEITNWIFCDCDLQLTGARPEGGEEGEKNEDEMLMRILPDCNQTTAGKISWEILQTFIVLVSFTILDKLDQQSISG